MTVTWLGGLEVVQQQQQRQQTEERAEEEGGEDVGDVARATEHTNGDRGDEDAGWRGWCKGQSVAARVAAKAATQQISFQCPRVLKGIQDPEEPSIEYTYRSLFRILNRHSPRTARQSAYISKLALPAAFCNPLPLLLCFSLPLSHVMSLAAAAAHCLLLCFGLVFPIVFFFPLSARIFATGFVAIQFGR